jgi:hypothetical protein
MSPDSQLMPQAKPKTDQVDTTGRVGTASARKILIGILVVATLLRLGSAWYQGNTVVPLPGIYDQISYDTLAQRVIEGHGFSFATGWWPATRAGEPTAHWSYLYTLYLAAVYALFGYQPLVARLIQAIVAGVLHGWLVWCIGRRIFGPITGLIAAGLSAVYIYFFYYAGGLLTETFYILGILWTLDAALRLAARARPIDADRGGLSTLKWWHWLELGLAIGVTVLLRQLFLLFAPFLFLWLWWNFPQPQSTASGPLSRWSLFRWPALKGLLLATVVIALLIVPWTVRNYRAFNTFVPLNTNAGFALFWGNHPIYGTHFVGLLPSGDYGYYELIPEELRPLNEAALDRALLKRGIGFVVDDPVRIILLSLSRTREYFTFWPSAKSSTISNLSRVGSFGIALPFMLYGLWLSMTLVRHPEPRGQRSELILLYLFVTVYTGIHLASWALIRYRLPVDAVLLIFAALGLQDLARRLMSIFNFSRAVPTPAKPQ